MLKNISILGSTGSIGTSALNVIAKHPDKFKVVALTAGANVELLAKQIQQYKPQKVAVANKEAFEKLKSYSLPKGIQIAYGKQGIREVASYEKADFVLSAIVGSAGLLPTLDAVRLGKTIGLANKETLVMAGQLVMKEASKSACQILPVDSEHSAIFQCLHGYERSSVSKIILTASGGPFLGMSLTELEKVDAKMALKHPNWSMGKKITIDSATLMNKGLEVIEAHYLFGFDPKQIDVVIHPQSIIHSMVEFQDGVSLAQLSVPDMQAPIAFALSYPQRLPSILKPINWTELHSLTFLKPDKDAFVCLRLAYDALETGGAMPCVLNSANEVAVEAFLHNKIGFNQIPTVIDKAMSMALKTKLITNEAVSDIDDILHIDKVIRDFTHKELTK